MVNWVFAATLLAVASAAPQSYIVGPGHFHYEFGGQNEFKYATPAPAVKAAPVATVAPVVAPIVKKVEYQVNPITYSAPVTVRPIKQQVTVSQYPAQPYSSQYSSQYGNYRSQYGSYPSQNGNYGSQNGNYGSQYGNYGSQYGNYRSQYNTYGSQYGSNPSQYGSFRSQYSYPYGNQGYVSQSEGVTTVPQYNKITVPVATVRSQPVTPVVSVQKQQPISQVYSAQAQSGHNYGRYAILRYIFDIQPYGGYNYAYETENGIKAEESGELKNAGSQDEAEVAQGYYTYTAPDGVVYTVRYVADENGFRAEGDHLPKIPEAIQRSLEYLRTLPPQPDEQKK